MRILGSILAGTLIAFTPAVASQAQTADDHAIVTPQDIAWEPGPPSLPPGAEYDVLYGDPAEEGQFVMRLKMPAGYHIPPHTHPKLESVTVIYGTFRLGMGETPDREAAQTLETGGYFGMPPGMVHYAYADEETVVQLNGLGPWQINYVNPADDPRQGG